MPIGKRKKKEIEARERAKLEWLKHHPEDTGMFEAITKQKQQKPNKPNKRRISNDKIFPAVMGFISFFVLVGLWVALFCGVEIGVFVLPLFTALFYTFSTMYFRQSESFDKVCLFFVVCIAISVITSLISGFSSNTYISGTAIINFILASVFYGFMTKTQ